MTEGTTDWQPQTWGVAIGLLAFSVATLVGITTGLEPETICLRAGTGGLAAGGVTLLASRLVRLGARTGDEE